MMTVLEAVRDALAAVDGVKTCRIGMEPDITPDDYPLVRLVPSSLSEVTGIRPVRKVAALIYFGINQHDFEAGLEELYAELLAMERKLLQAASAQGTAFVRHIETLMDEDALDGYKLMALRVSIEAQSDTFSPVS